MQARINEWPMMGMMNQFLCTYQPSLSSRTSERTIISWMVLVYLLVVLTCAQGTTQEVDICKEAHKFRCENGELISLAEIICGQQRSCTPHTNKTLFDLCQGQQTCSNLGIENILGSSCRNETSPTDPIRVKYNCIQGYQSSCITNICADSSAGLICPEGSLVHLTDMTCYTITGRCPRSVYTNMFLCEGVSRCAASGLKTLLSQNCQNEVQEKRNIIVHYVCVPEQQIDNKCSTNKYRILDKEFGILRSPFLDSNIRQSGIELNNQHLGTECRWIINPIRGSRVKVTVHLVSTKVTRSNCDLPGVLNISFEECISRTVITKSFCVVDNSSVDLISCGQVKIISVVPHGLESADKFVLSYEKYQSKISKPEASGLPSCVAPMVISTPQILLQPSSSPRSAQQEVPSSFNTPITITSNLDHVDDVIEYRDVTVSNVNKQTSPFTKHLKLIILYIIFGVVILVLTVSLIAVLISYYRISKLNNNGRGDSSEKTALCQHREDTPLDTFQNPFTDSCGTSETTYAFRTDPNNTDQVMATIHHDACSDQEEFDHRLSSGSRISTFLSGKRDTDFRDLINTFQSGTFALYSNLGNSSSNEHINIGDAGYYEMADAGHYDIPNDHDIYEVIDQEKYRSNGIDNNQVHPLRNDIFTLRNHVDENNTVSNHDNQPPVNSHPIPSSDLHYRVNNDEYAVVNKPLKESKRMLCDEDQHKQYESCLDNSGSVDFCPALGPYDKKRRSAAESNARWSKGDRERWGDEL